jgi:hypothetical protein
MARSAPVRYVGVIGGRECSRETARLAYQVGRGIAREGWTLVCGGMGGVMEMACRGARSAGGPTLGILPGNRREEGNPYLSCSVVTGMGEARNVIVVKTSQVLVAVGGSYGTLSEIALANVFGTPVVGLQTWQVDPRANEGRSLFRRQAGSAEEAVRLVKELLEGPGPPTSGSF